MPLVQGRKRRSAPEPEEDPASSPEPATQRRRIAQHVASDDDEAYGADAATQADSNQDQQVKKLVRLALACEYQRKPIRRADVSEKVLGSGATRQFRGVWERAQVELRSVFGMEMVELPSREKVQAAGKRVAKSQSQQSKTPQTWILTSILPAPFRDHEILPPPSVPTSEEESKYVSIYTLLISLISLSGGQLPATKFDRYLRRLLMEDNSPLAAFPKTEHLLKRLEREGYIVKVKEPTGAGDEDIYWTVGPRGKVEVGEDGMRGLTRAVYGELDEAEAEELGRNMERSLGIGREVPSSKSQGHANGQSQPKKRGRKRKDAEEEEEQGKDDDE